MFGYIIFYYLWLLFAEWIIKDISVDFKRENESKIQLCGMEFYRKMEMGL